MLKNTLETTNPAADSAASHSAGSAPRADHLSADAVSLEVAVRVHGSRVVEAARGATPHTEPFEEQTTTMIVFPQGGVLRMATTVSIGQMLVLTNIKTKQDAICRVVKVRTYSNLAGYVEVEFTSTLPGFWGVNFAPDGLETARKHAAQPTETLGKPASSDTISEFPSAQAVSKPAVAPLAPAASMPATPSKVTAVIHAPVPVPNVTVPKHSASSGSLTSPVREPAERSPAAEISVEPLSEKFGAIAGGDAGSSRTASEQLVPRTSFGASFESNDEPGETAKPWQDWRLIAGGVGLVAVIAVGALFMARSRASERAVAQLTPATVSTPAPAVSEAPVTSAPPAVSQPARSAPPVKASEPTPALVAKQASPTKPVVVEAPKPAAPVETEPIQDNAAARPKPAVRDVTSDLFGALNAHPVAGRHDSEGQSQAPNVDAAPTVASGGPAPAMPGSAAAPLMPFGSSRTGAPQVKEPRLLSSVLPTYPAAAKQTHIEGEVVIDATIDQTGKVAEALVTSGPATLRQAAVEALRLWRYEPGTLDGRPVPAKVTVRIKFHL